MRSGLGAQVLDEQVHGRGGVPVADGVPGSAQRRVRDRQLDQPPGRQRLGDRVPGHESRAQAGQRARHQSQRGYTTEEIMDTILRRMPDYVNYICPQFSRTHVNFQRVPTVDTSNPFIARFIPTADESFVVIRLADPRGIDFPYLLSMLHDSFMSRPNSIVVPGGKMELAMQLIFTPMILRLMDKRSRRA